MRQMTSEVQLETMVTVRQVADFLHVSISTIRRWSGSGMLKSYRVGPRGDRRYLRDDVLRFLEECTSHPQGGTMMERNMRASFLVKADKFMRQNFRSEQ